MIVAKGSLIVAKTAVIVAEMQPIVAKLKSGAKVENDCSKTELLDLAMQGNLFN